MSQKVVYLLGLNSKFLYSMNTYQVCMRCCARHCEGHVRADTPKMRQSCHNGKVVHTQGCPAEGQKKDFTETGTFMAAHARQAVCPAWKLSPGRTKKHISRIHIQVLGRLASGGFGPTCHPPSNDTNLTTTFLIQVFNGSALLKGQNQGQVIPKVLHIV